MKTDLLSIGKMAKLNRVSISTLRLYDEKGLLKPRYTDPDSGYRYYDIYQNARLDMIAYMKELGMSLSEIAEVFQKEDLTLIEDILSKKMNRSTNRFVSCAPDTTRWNARSFPLSATENLRLRERCLWNILTDAISGASHAPIIFTTAIYAALKKHF